MTKIEDYRYEDNFQKDVVQYLMRINCRCLWFAIPNGGKRSRKTGALLKATGTRAGVADLCFIKDGKAHFMELKIKRRPQNDAQKLFERDCEKHGAPYVICRDMEAVYDALAEWGI